MLTLLVTCALQVAPAAPVRALLEAAPTTPSGEVVVDVVLDASGGALQLVLRGESEARLADWSCLWGSEGGWSVDAPLWRAALPGALLELPEPATDVVDHRALFEANAPEAWSGTVRGVEHARAHDGREFASLRVQVEGGDLVRVALGPSGWHARAAGLPEVGAEVGLRAVSTRDARGLVWIAAGLRVGESPELRVRSDAGAPAWAELGVAPLTTSAASLLGRRVRVGDAVVGRVDDLRLERGSGAPRTTLVVARGAGGGPPVPVEWGRASVENDGSLSLRSEDWQALESASPTVHTRASGSAATGPTRIGDSRGASRWERFPGASAARCRRP